MKNKILHLWQEHRILLIGFVIVSLFTCMILARIVIGAVIFNRHDDRPIKPWMPIGFIAKTYHVPPDILLEAAGIPMATAHRLRLQRIADETGVPYQQLIEKLLEAVHQYRLNERPNP